MRNHQVFMVKEALAWNGAETLPMKANDVKINTEKWAKLRRKIIGKINIGKWRKKSKDLIPSFDINIDPN